MAATADPAASCAISADSGEVNQESEERFEQRALACAVGTEQADGAGREHRRHVVQREVLAVADAQLIGLDDRAVEAGAGRSRVRHVGIW